MGLFFGTTTRSGTLVLSSSNSTEYVTALVENFAIQFEDMGNTKRSGTKLLDRLTALLTRFKNLNEGNQYAEAFTTDKEFEEKYSYIESLSLEAVERAVLEYCSHLTELKVNVDESNQRVKELENEQAVCEQALTQFSSRREYQQYLAFDGQGALDRDSHNSAGSMTIPLLVNPGTPSRRFDSRFSVLSGVIESHESSRFERTVFSLTRGNAFTIITQIAPTKDDSESGALCTFVVYYPGPNDSVLASKLNVLAGLFQASIFQFPSDYVEANQRIQDLSAESIETRKTRDFSTRLLHKEYDIFKERHHILCLAEMFLIKQIVIARILEQFEQDASTCRCAIIFLEADQNQIQAKLNELSPGDSDSRSALLLLNGESKTYRFDCTTDLIEPYDDLCNAYGLPARNEIRPSIFAVALFPITFGIMYGDVGHGSMIVGFGAYLMFYLPNEPESNSPLAYIYKWRLAILILGLSSCFFGLLYGDMFGQSLKLASSSFKASPVQLKPGSRVFVHEMIEPGNAYPFGIDWRWKEANNTGAYTNDLKTKISLVFGFLHMSLGLLLRALNNLYNYEYTLLLVESAPMIALFMMTVGYAVYLVIFQLLHPCIDDFPDDPNAIKASSIIHTITKLIFNEELQEDEILFEGMKTYHEYFLQIFCFATLLLFLGKPVYMTINRNSDIDVSEVWVLQSINTLEYVIGLLSNTASYLRLWALSLAHEELTKIIWSFFIAPALGDNLVMSIVKLLLLTPVFCLTTAVMMLAMEVLECFLHALRLQWVEFQNKFFRGEGHLMKPCNLKMRVKELLLLE